MAIHPLINVTAPPSNQPCALRFEMRHGDADILQLLEESVPPADISKVSIFAQPLAKYNQEVGESKYNQSLVILSGWLVEDPKLVLFNLIYSWYLFIPPIRWRRATMPEPSSPWGMFI